MRVVLLTLVLSTAACGASTSESSTTVDTGLGDASAETSTSGCTEAVPAGYCFGGATGRACADVGYAYECVANAWKCPALSVPQSECGCRAGPVPGGGAPIKNGDPCPPKADTGVPEAGTCDCLASKLTWGWNGGEVAYSDTSSITPCRTYDHRRDFGSGTMPKTCTAEMLKCTDGDALDMSDIQAALANLDVVNAFKAAPILYGKDSRPVDGQVYRIDFAGKVIEVGGDCGGVAGCKPVPEGVKSLVSLLKTVDTTQLAVSPCKGAF